MTVMTSGAWGWGAVGLNECGYLILNFGHGDPYSCLSLFTDASHPTSAKVFD